MNVGDLVLSKVFGGKQAGIIVETFPHDSFEDALRIWFFRGPGCGGPLSTLWPGDQLHRLEVISESR